MARNIKQLKNEIKRQSEANKKKETTSQSQNNKKTGNKNKAKG